MPKTPSWLDTVEHIVALRAGGDWGSISPQQIRQIAAVADATQRLIALNQMFGDRRAGIEHSYDFATSSRQQQLQQFADYYFGDLGVDLVYTDEFGATQFGQFIEPGEEFGGILYERGAIVISEQAFQMGWEEVGITLFHEWLEQFRGELTHEEIYEFERLWEEWFNQ